MALQKTYNLENGLTATNAYWRIEQFTGDRNKLQIIVNAYTDSDAAVVDEETKATAKPPVYSKPFSFPTPNTSTNMFASAYEWLKTQDFFTDATDC